jgi:hypothetical protein
MVKITDLEAELANGRIYEATLITDDGSHLMGMCDTTAQTITIDPKVLIVSTLIHELIHRLHPAWGERRVRLAEKRALRQLSQHDIQVWYRRYKRAVRKRRPMDALEYEG